MRRLLACIGLFIALPVTAGDVCLDRAGVWVERPPGALFDWEYHVYVDRSEVREFGRMRPNQVRDVLVDAGWKSIPDRDLLVLSREIHKLGDDIMVRNQGCGVMIRARATDRPPGEDATWLLEITSRGVPDLEGHCIADCFGHGGR